MLDYSVAKDILDGLLSGASTKRIEFSGSVYLGLLTKLPNANGAAHEDGSYFSEPTDPEYIRIRIDTTSRINGKNFIASAQNGDIVDVGGTRARSSYVANQGMILFPETSEPCTIVGFGLFRNSLVGDTTLPFLWGAITDDDGAGSIEIGKHEVPVIREGGFKVSLV